MIKVDIDAALLLIQAALEEFPEVILSVNYPGGQAKALATKLNLLVSDLQTIRLHLTTEAQQELYRVLCAKVNLLLPS